MYESDNDDTILHLQVVRLHDSDDTVLVSFSWDSKNNTDVQENTVNRTGPVVKSCSVLDTALIWE